MRLQYKLFLTAISLSLTSCDFVTTAYKETFQIKDSSSSAHTADSIDAIQAADPEDEVAITDKEPVNILQDAEKLANIQDKLQAMFPGKPLSIYPPHIYFDTDRIRVQVVNPDIPEHIDWYYYDAETDSWEIKDPVKTSVHLKRSPIPLAAVNFSTAHLFYQQLIAKVSEVEGSTVPESIYFTFNVSKWNWNASIIGSRADYEFTADKDGKEIGFKKR